MEIWIGLTGLVVGAVLAYVLARAGSQSQLTALQTQRDQLQVDLAATQAARDAALAAERTIREQANHATNELSRLQGERTPLLEALRQAQAERTDVLQRLEAANQQAASLHQQVVNLQANAATDREQHQRRVAELKTAHEDQLALLRREFATAQEALKTEIKTITQHELDGKSKLFKEQNQEQLGLIVSPLNQQIKEFKDRIEQISLEAAKERVGLSSEIKQAAEKTQLLSLQAENLTKALKGQAKLQGNWGENILRTILETNGLADKISYLPQLRTTDEDGSVKIPDYVINLPGDRHLVIDSKVVLKSYEEYFSSTEDQTKSYYLKQFIAAVKKHIDDLHKANYPKFVSENALQHTVMFMPLDGAYLLLLNEEPRIWETAYSKGVILATPTLLMSILSVVTNFWRVERQEQNTKAIFKVATKIHQQIVKLQFEMEKSKKALENAVDHHSNAYKRMYTGRENVMSLSTKLEHMGAKSESSLPADFVLNVLESIDEAEVVEQSDSLELNQ